MVGLQWKIHVIMFTESVMSHDCHVSSEILDKTHNSHFVMRRT